MPTAPNVSGVSHDSMGHDVILFALVLGLQAGGRERGEAGVAAVLGDPGCIRAMCLRHCSQCALVQQLLVMLLLLLLPLRSHAVDQWQLGLLSTGGGVWLPCAQA